MNYTELESFNEPVTQGSQQIQPILWARVVVADSHPVVRFGVKSMLEPKQGFSVVGEASDGEEAIAQVLELSPEILLLDLGLPRMSGFDVLRAIVSRVPRVKILLLASAVTAKQTIEALQSGARGILLKDMVVDDLYPALRAVASGDYWIEGERVTNLFAAVNGLVKRSREAAARAEYGLTPREVEVIACLVEGSTNRDIAQQFGISEETVKRHLSNIFEKVGVTTRLELAMFALTQKLIKPEN